MDWPSKATDERVRVIHLLLVRPDAAGQGIGSALIAYVTDLAKQQNCSSIRLDTGAQNTPATALYIKQGYRLVSASSMKIGGVIPHDEHLFFEKIV
ncbi:MAG: GNAT family N-acetyltransferase [Bacillota bacterium]|nr:GNAT family N-acetyltransferase [Bacillota bacterium]